MPTNPASPNSSAAVDRLTLGIADVRGPGHPSMLYNNASGVVSYCFEAESSGITCVGGFLCAEATGAQFG